MDKEEIKDEMRTDADGEREERFSDILKEGSDDAGNKERSDGGMEWFEEHGEVHLKPGGQQIDFHQIRDEGTDDDQGDVLFGGFPGDPSNQRVGEPIRHGSASVQNDGCLG